MRLLALSAFFVAAVASGCAPATTYNRGIDISFHPSGKADAQERLVSSAMELKTEDDTTLVKEAGGIYLGELEVVGEKAGAMFMGKGGGGTLSGRVSLEAASRGATHFFLASSRVENGVEVHHTRSGSSSTPTSTTHARFVLFRVDPQSWEKLPLSFRPEPMPSAKGSGPAPASAAPAAAATEQKL